MAKSFQEFSKEAVELSALPVRADLADEWRKLAAAADPDAQADEMTARRLAEAFADYLRACKHDERALSTLPPGRFLMPGDLDGSPALTFSPLVIRTTSTARPGVAARDDGAALRSLQDACDQAVLPRAYRPARPPDRAGRRAAGAQCRAVGGADLERALAEILTCFRIGRGGFLTDLFSHRIGRILDRRDQGRSSSPREP